MDSIITTPQDGVSTHVPAPAPAPAETLAVSGPVEDVAPLTWGDWTLASELDAKALVSDMLWAVHGLLPIEDGMRHLFW